MRTALRRMGNSVAMIVPKPVLQAAGLANGAALDLAVEEGRLVATPVASSRVGWSDAASAIGPDEAQAEETQWRAFGVEEDLEWEW